MQYPKLAWWQYILTLFLFWKIILYTVIFSSNVLIPAASMLKHFDPDYKFNTHTPIAIWVWSNFDGKYYTDIARRGYFGGEEPFFPLYPILIRYVHDITKIRYLVSGQIVSNLAFLAALVLLIKLLAIDGKKSLAYLFFLIIFLFPTSYYYSAIYNDAPFLAFASAAILFSRKRQWLAACIAGSLATATRLNGLALFFFIMVEYLVSDQWNMGQWRLWVSKLADIRQLIADKIIAVTLIPLTFLGYLAYIQITSDHWTDLFTSMKPWGQDKVILPIQVAWRYIKILFIHPNFSYAYSIAAAEFAAVVLYAVLLIFFWKKIRLSYWVLFFLSILIPSATGTFQGMPRYGLHLYPFFLTLTMAVDRFPSIWKWAYFILSFAGLVTFLALFSRGYFVA